MSFCLSWHAFMIFRVYFLLTIWCFLWVFFPTLCLLCFKSFKLYVFRVHFIFDNMLFELFILHFIYYALKFQSLYVFLCTWVVVERKKLLALSLLWIFWGMKISVENTHWKFVNVFFLCVCLSLCMHLLTICDVLCFIICF